MNYKPCRECGFWVTLQDKHCPNCGIVKPQMSTRSDQKGSKKPLFYWLVGASLGGLFGFLLGGWFSTAFWGFIGLCLAEGMRTASTSKPLGADSDIWFGVKGGAVIAGIYALLYSLVNPSDPIWLAALFALLIAGGIFGTSIGGILAIVLVPLGREVGKISNRVRQSLLSRRSRTHLRQQEEVVRQRLRRVEERQRQVQGALARVRAEWDAERWQKLEQTLLKAAAIAARQVECCRAELWEIELVRWYNRLQALRANGNLFTYAECERRLQALEGVGAHGKAMLQAWERTDVAETPYGQNCLERLRAGLESCEQLRQALVEAAALLALKDIEPLEEVHRPAANLTVNLEQLDILNANVAAIRELSEVYSELETEYDRLAIEEQVAQQLQSMTRG